MTSLPFVKGEKKVSHETSKRMEWVCFSSLMYVGVVENGKVTEMS